MESLVDEPVRTVLDALSTPVALLDADRVIVHLNEAWRSTFQNGTTAAGEEFQIGRPYGVCVGDAVGAGTDDEGAIDAAMQGVRSERMSRHEGGGERWWIHTRVMPHGHGTQRGVLIEKEDVSERMDPEGTAMSYQAVLHAVHFAASRFLDGSPWETRIQEVLRRLGEALSVSRVYVFERSTGRHGGEVFRHRYEWVTAGLSGQLDDPAWQEVDVDALGMTDWVELFEGGHLVQGVVRSMPEPLRSALSVNGVLALALVPVYAGKLWWGALGVDECTSERAWTLPELEALRAAAGLLGAAIEGRWTREELERGVVQAEYARGQEEMLRALEAPILPVHDRVLVMPIVGDLRVERLARAQEALLQGTVARGAEAVILDLTGMRHVEEGSIAGLTRMARAVRLLGATVILTGIAPEVAQALTLCGSDLNGLATCSNLQAGIAKAIQLARRR
ncbi:uncharacterized protein CMC5_042140 [Chondromyces crocatus]|uniref:STAS domain-containing protein n=2 Tax=Chondromyces crocatus TaxID=52 RepID=A0A0K1EGT0_CHOCO|nr:uncharacterized protein CMC5_042140 [Chondromyces crocatus]